MSEWERTRASKQLCNNKNLSVAFKYRKLSLVLHFLYYYFRNALTQHRTRQNNIEK